MFQPAPGGVIIDVRVTPRARTSAVVGTRSGALHVRLAAPPVDGAANAELIELIADELDVPKRSVTIVSGKTSRQKRVLVGGIDAQTAASRIQVSRR